MSDANAPQPGTSPIRTQETSARIVETEPLSHDVTQVLLRLPSGQNFKWFAGQYLELLLPQGDCAFSIACAPEDTVKDIQLHVRHNADNPLSLEIMAALEAHPTVDIRIPSGSRFINALPQQPVWLIAGSTGFAQSKAIIEHLRDLGFKLPIHLFWGGRSQADLYQHELAQDWQTEMPNFIYHPVLSDKSHRDFESGLVHESACALLEQEDTPATTPLFFVSGSPAMAWATHDALVEKGVRSEQIHSDVYDYAPR